MKWNSQCRNNQHDEVEQPVPEQPADEVEQPVSEQRADEVEKPVSEQTADKVLQGSCSEKG